MISKNQFMNSLIGKPVVDAVVCTLYNQCDDFSKVHQAFLHAIERLHYFGYLMGNELLQHCVPGYHPDMVLDIKYTHMLEKYFGCRLSMDQWEGCFCMKDWKIAPIPEELPQDTMTYREQIQRETYGQ